MKHFYIYLSLLMLAATGFISQAQTVNQPGEVRSISYRLGHEGSPVADVRLTVMNEVRSDNQGQFMIPVRLSKDNTFSFICVEKNGYVLINPLPEDMITAKFAINQNAKVRIVMAGKEELYKERKRIERLIRQAHEEEIAQRDSIISRLTSKIDSLRKQNADVTALETEYKKLKSELNEYKEHYYDSDNEILEEADGLSRIDYYQLDSIQAKIVDLKKAGKGLEAAQYAGSQISKKMWRAINDDPASVKRNLEKQKKKYESALEEMHKTRAMLLNMYEGYRISFMNDKAAESLKLYADMDSDDIEAQIEYAKFIFSYLDKYDDAIRILESLMEKAEKKHDLLLQASIMDLVGQVKYTKGNIKESIGILQKALSIIEKNPDIDLEGRILHNLGLAYNQIGLTDSSATYLCKAIDVRDKCQDKEQLANSLLAYTMMLSNTDSVKKAIPYLKRAESLMLDYDPEDASFLPSLYLQSGHMCKKLSDYSGALENYLKALELIEKRYGTAHSASATIYTSIADLYTDVGLYNKALNYLEHAKKINDSLYGRYHIETILTQSSYLETLVMLGKSQEALDGYAELIEDAKSSESLEKRLFAILYHNFAICCQETGKYEQAESNFLMAIELIRESGSNILEMANNYNSLGTLYLDMTRYQEAVDNFYKALDIYKTELSVNHFQLCMIHNNIAIAYKRMGISDKYFEELGIALDIAEHIDNPRLLGTEYNNIGSAYVDYNNLDKAEVYIKKAIEVREKLDDFKSCAESWVNLGNLYLMKLQDEDALKAFKTALDIYHKGFGKEEYNYAYCCFMIYNTYNRMEMTEPAGEYAKKAYEIFNTLTGPDSEPTKECMRMLKSLEARKGPHIYTLTINSEGNLAKRGYSGTYSVLEYNDWNCTLKKDISAYGSTVKPSDKKTIVFVNDDNRIHSETFESGSMGITWGVEPATKKEVTRIQTLYLNYIH